MFGYRLLYTLHQKLILCSDFQRIGIDSLEAILGLDVAACGRILHEAIWRRTDPALVILAHIGYKIAEFKDRIIKILKHLHGGFKDIGLALLTP